MRSSSFEPAPRDVTHKLAQLFVHYAGSARHEGVWIAFEQFGFSEGGQQRFRTLQRHHTRGLD